MHRIHVPSAAITGDAVLIADKKTVHYIKDVLRLKPGMSLVIFDERGVEYRCLVDAVSAKVSLSIQQRRFPQKKEPVLSLTIACAVPKNSRMEDSIDKLTQLGVERIIPLACQRSVVRIAKDREAARLKRWQQVAVSAAQQSQRNTIPSIELPVTVAALLKKEGEDFDLKLIPYLGEGEERISLKKILEDRVSASAKVLVLIGPEGDFSQDEVATALQYGCVPVSLGETVLRVETAAVAAASFIMLFTR